MITKDQVNEIWNAVEIKWSHSNAEIDHLLTQGEGELSCTLDGLFTVSDLEKMVAAMRKIEIIRNWNPLPKNDSVPGMKVK